MEIVARFKSPFQTKFGIPRQSGVVPDLCGEIHFEPEYAVPEALRGLDGFDYIWLIWEFSANVRDGGWQPTVRPPRLGGNASLGVFATRSPFRPNPIGLSSVKVERIDYEKMVIYVKGADLMDGTPIYDIKPYVAYTDSHPDAVCGFVDNTPWNGLEVVFPESLASGFSPEQLASLKGCLAQDPRPRYKRDEGTRVYGLMFGGMDVRFVVASGVLTVIDVRSKA